VNPDGALVTKCGVSSETDDDTYGPLSRTIRAGGEVFAGDF
jgi:hypothetical protein